MAGKKQKKAENSTEISTPKKHRQNSTFTVEQEVFIVEQFAILKSPKAVKNAFVKKYKGAENSRKLWKLHLSAFQRVYDRFKQNGVSPSKENPTYQRDVDRTDPQKIVKIGDHFAENPCDSLFNASKKLDIPVTTIHRILTKKLGMHPYKLTLGQALTAAHKAGRLDFCQWLIEQPVDFEQIVIFGDEKWFQLTQHPNRQNTRIWGVQNPYQTADTKVQGCAKVQAFVCVVDGRVLPVVWHIDENGKNISVNSERYVEAVKEVISHLPQRKLKKLWWQQDGAPCHTSNRTMEELRKVFGNRLISKGKDATVPWPARSPDLNPLDFCFWGMAMKEVWEKKPQTIPELMSVVENFFENLSPDLVRKCVGNIRKRAQFCVKNKGGHFENQL